MKATEFFTGPKNLEKEEKKRIKSEFAKLFSKELGGKPDWMTDEVIDAVIESPMAEIKEGRIKEIPR